MNPNAPLTHKLVRCPGCRLELAYSPSNPFRPFCSQRCKEIDLGAWASENFRLPEADASAADTAETDTPRHV